MDRILGNLIGKEIHQLTINEIVSHNHHSHNIRLKLTNNKCHFATTNTQTGIAYW